MWLLRAEGLGFTGEGRQRQKEGKQRGEDVREKGRVGLRGQKLYFENPVWELWMGGNELLGGLSSFVLTWTLFYGLVRA